MKKININTSFIADLQDGTRTLSKLKFEFTMVDSDTGNIIKIPRTYEPELGKLLVQILSRWDGTTGSLTLTLAQWNALKAKIQKILLK